MPDAMMPWLTGGVFAVGLPLMVVAWVLGVREARRNKNQSVTPRGEDR